MYQAYSDVIKNFRLINNNLMIIKFQNFFNLSESEKR